MIIFIDNLNKTMIEDKELTILRKIDAVKIVTSKFSELDGFEEYTIQFFNEEQSIEIFYTYYTKKRNIEDLKYIKELVNLVSCHTLSVEFLAKSANNRKYSLPKYLESLKQKVFGYPQLQVHTNHTQQNKTIAEHLSKLFSLEEVSEE